MPKGTLAIIQALDDKNLSKVRKVVSIKKALEERDGQKLDSSFKRTQHIHETYA